MNDPFNLDRFAEAQAGTYAAALAELRAGTKTSHWMWFVFPQIAGLGRSPTARFYAISSLDEARAYLAHPILGQRLRECVAAVQALPFTDAVRLFGHVDAAKFRSSLTLFVEAGGGKAFEDALTRWSGGPDEATLDILRAASPPA